MRSDLGRRLAKLEPGRVCPHHHMRLVCLFCVYAPSGWQDRTPEEQARMDALFHKLGPDPRYARCPSCGEEAVGCAICIARHYSNMSAPLTGAEVEELLALAERVGIEGEGAR